MESLTGMFSKDNARCAFEGDADEGRLRLIVALDCTEWKDEGVEPDCGVFCDGIRPTETGVRSREAGEGFRGGVLEGGVGSSTMTVDALPSWKRGSRDGGGGISCASVILPAPGRPFSRLSKSSKPMSESRRERGGMEAARGARGAFGFTGEGPDPRRPLVDLATNMTTRRALHDAKHTQHTHHTQHVQRV